MTSKRVMQIQVVHSDRDALDSMITDLVSERLNSYDVPEILVTEITGGYMPYLDWVQQTVQR
jgi:uncharacterized protein involved in tolerance to divalent cations